ncbi:MAG: hypothetical protein ACE361_24670 [Aureliella sp.]
MSLKRMLDSCFKYRKAGLAAALATVTLGSFVFAQEATSPAVVEGFPISPPIAEGFPAPRLAIGQQVPAVWGVESRNAVAGYAERRKEQSKMGEALKVLRDEDASEGERREAKESIAELLDKQFESDLENRENQIAELEKQIDQLRAQIKKRRAAKERLIDLRVELMVNEAEGLGFPSSWGGSNRFFAPRPSLTYPATPVAPTAPAALPGLTTRPSAAGATTIRRYNQAAGSFEEERVTQGQSGRRGR